MLLLFLVLDFIPEFDGVDMDFDGDPQPPLIKDEEWDVDARLRRGDGQPNVRKHIGDGFSVEQIEESKRKFREERVKIRGERRDLEKSFFFECKMPHTHRAYGGATCVCDDGYVGFDPMNKGCWKCEQVCHENAACVEGGVCECAEGYVGDGVSSCEYDYPEMLNVVPKICTRGGCALNITIKKGRTSSHKGYCLFDDLTVDAYKVRDNVFTCKVPMTISWKSSVRFSWDAQHGSLNSFTVFFRKEVDWDDDSVIVLLLFLVLFGTGAIIWYKRKHQPEPPRVVAKAKGRRKKPKKSEYETL